MGGIGKTQLGVEFARRHQSSYSSIFFIHADSKESLLHSFLAIFRRISIPDQLKEDRNSTAQLEERAKQVLTWLDSEGNDNWLLIFDNVDRAPSDIDGFDIQAYFPARDIGSILVTTRLASLPIDGHRRSLLPMSLNQSSMLLRSYVLNIRSTEAELKLLDSLAGLPLALSQAGRFISTLNIDIEEYLGLYNSSKVEVMDLLPNSTYGGRSKGNTSVATSWTTSINLLKERMSREDECGEHYRGYQLLKLFTYFDPTNLDYEVLRRGLIGNDVPNWFRATFQSKISFYSTIQVLLDLSLLDKTEKSGSYAMHRVMYEWLVSTLVPDNDIGFLTLAVSAVGFSAPNILLPNWPHEQARLILHANALLPRLLPLRYALPHVDFKLLVPEDLRCVATLLDDEPQHLLMRRIEHPLRSLCDLLSVDGKGTEALYILKGSIKYLQEQNVAEEDPVLLVLIYAKCALSRRKNIGEDEDVFCRLLKTFGSLNLPYWTIRIRNIQALNLVGQQKINEAFDCWQALLRQCSTVYGPFHYLTSMVFNNMAARLFAIDLSKKKEVTQSMRVEAEATALVNPGARDVLTNLGTICVKYGEFKEADTLFRRVLHLEIELNGKDSIEVGRAHSDLACLGLKFPQKDSIFHCQE